MKRILIYLVLFVGLASFAPVQPVTGSLTAEVQKRETTVLICNSSGAYAYHAYVCRGLKNCKSDILEVTVDEAIQRGKGKPCGYCY